MTRKKLFEQVQTTMKSRPLIYPLDKIPTKNTIYAIDFSRQIGAHYAGVFSRLIEKLEEDGLQKKDRTLPINPDTSILVEPSTGNGGEDFALAATRLGYEAFVVMPDGMPESRYEGIEHVGGKVIRTPAEDYSLGMRNKLVHLIRSNGERIARGEKMFISPNHCGQGMSDITTKIMENMINQYIDEVGVEVDIAVIAMGNGSSIYGPGRRLKEVFPRAKVIGTESVASGLAYDKMYGDYRELFGLDPGSAELMRHFRLYGTNAPLGAELPSQDKAIAEKVVDEIALLSTDVIDKAHMKAVHGSGERVRLQSLPHWDFVHKCLEKWGYDFGHSSAAGIEIAIRKLRQKPGKALCIVYDNSLKYR